MRETDLLIISAMKRRETLSEPLWRISDILESFNVGLFKRTCCQKILEEVRIDSKHVQVDYRYPGEVFIDKVGLMKCEGILGRYLDEEQLEGLEDDLIDTSDIYRNLNVLIDHYLTCSKKTLKDDLEQYQNIKDSEGYKKANDEEEKNLALAAESLVLCIGEELENRKFPKNCCVWFRKVLRKAMKLVNDKKNQEYIENLVAGKDKQQTEYTIMPFSEKEKRYVAIYEQYRNIPLQNMSEDNLMKFIWSGVKALGVLKMKRNARQIEEFVEAREKESCKIFAAIGMLTPKQFMQIFPVKKEFRKEEGWKNYDSVMKAAHSFGEDKPIGDWIDACCFLDEYLNHDTNKFMVQWIMNASDVQSLTEKDPWLEMRNRQKIRYGTE